MNGLRLGLGLGLGLVGVAVAAVWCAIYSHTVHGHRQ